MSYFWKVSNKLKSLSINTYLKVFFFHSLSEELIFFCLQTFIDCPMFVLPFYVSKIAWIEPKTKLKPVKQHQHEKQANKSLMLTYFMTLCWILPNLRIYSKEGGIVSIIFFTDTFLSKNKQTNMKRHKNTIEKFYCQILFDWSCH